MKKRENRTGCRLDPEKMPEYLQHFGSTFLLEPGVNLSDATSDLNELEPEKYTVPEEYIYRKSTGSLIKTKLLEAMVPFNIYRTIKKMAKGKAGGSDELVTELMCLPEILVDDAYVPDLTIANALSRLFTIICKFNVIPKQWQHARICPTWKQKGSMLDVQNYRPIALTSVVRRTFEKCVLRASFGKLIDRKLHWTQGGFRPARGTLQQVSTLHELAVRNSRMRMAFLDIKAAYDCVDRRILWAKLRSFFQIDDDMIGILQSLFEDYYITIIINGHESDRLSCLRGVLQGSSLSPILFNCFINDLLIRLERCGADCSVGQTFINNLFFADIREGNQINATSFDNMRRLE